MTIIYRVKAKESAWESKWFLTKRKAMACMRHMQYSYQAQVMFGKEYELEMAELDID